MQDDKQHKSIWLGRTAYQIMPDRFCRDCDIKINSKSRLLKDWNDRMPNWEPDSDGVYRNNYFYGGNLKGIESKLEYLKKLGFDMLYITPISKSSTYHHYDVEDHFEVDSFIGTWDDFIALSNKAKEFGILIVVDLVFNHTGVKSKYFKNPNYTDWYKKDTNGNQQYWWGFGDLPECNTFSKSYQDAMTQVVYKYLEAGANGIRLDLGANLPAEFLYAIQVVKEKYPNTIFIGEMWEIATDREDSKIFDNQLDSVMNYPMSDAILRWTRWGKAEHFKYNFDRVYKEYPDYVKNILLNNIATHDTPSAITMLVGDKMNDNVFDKRIWDIEAPWLNCGMFDTFKFREYEAEHDILDEQKYSYGKKLLKIALAILYIIPGIPCVYQGTEVADCGYKDPFNRKPYPWKKKETEIQDFIKKLGKYRKDNRDILESGEARIIYISDKILVLERFLAQKSIILAVNRTNNEVVANLGSTVTLEPYEVLIIRKN